MAVKTRAELIAQNTATFGNGKNTRGDDEKAFNLNHLDSFLNKKGDTLETNGYVAVQDGSKLKQGTNGGIAFECVVGYDFQWKEGVAYYRPTGGNIVIAMSAVDQVPNTGFDSSLFYAVGSRFTNLVTNVEYICTDASVGSATWSVVPSGGGSVTDVSVVTDNGFAGTSSGGATPAITLTTTVTGLLKGDGTAISAATAGTDYLTSVGLTMPSAFTVTTSPLTANGTLAVTGAGTASQYIRGDGALANFPTGGGGGGGTVYYLNGNTSQGSIGGTTMYQLSTAAGTGAAANFTRSTTGAIASFITDVGQPNQTTIPAGIWIFEAYLSESGGGSNHAQINAVVEKWDGSSITVISTGPIEEITNGSTKDLYQFAVTIPSGTTISASDRIVVQINISNANGKTVTLYTEDSNLSSVTTTFANGISSLNGLTTSTQFFATPGTTGTAPAWTSTTATHTLNIPLASASSVTAGLISKTDYDTFNAKMSNPMITLGDIVYGGTVTGGVADVTRLAGRTTNGIYLLRANVTASTAVAPDWLASTGSGNVVLATSPTLVTPVIGAARGTSLDVTGDLTSGVAFVTQGTVVLRNAGSTATQTIRGTNPTTSIIYDLPTTAPLAGNILAATAPSAGVSTLSWTAAGAGDMVLITPNQLVTGSKIYSDTTLLLRSSAGTAFYTTLSAGSTAANYTVTFPAATSTLACLGLAQTFSTLQTFSSGITVSSGTTTISTSGSSTTSVLSITSSTYPWVGWTSTSGTLNTPKFSTRSVGTRLVLLPAISGSSVDYAIGVNSAVTWISVSQNIGRVSFYGGETEFGFFTGTGLTLPVAGTSTAGQLTITPGAAGPSDYEYIDFGQYITQRAAPTVTTARSLGTRLILFKAFTATAFTDYALGVNTDDLWLSTASTAQTISMYAGATRVAWFSGAANVGLTFADGYNIVFNATTGTKIGTTTTQKLSFWNKTPIVQPTTGITGATRVGGAGIPVTTTDTYGGYTLAQIAAALVNTGILA